MIKTFISTEIQISNASFILLSLLLLVFPHNLYAESWPKSPDIKARSWALIDARSGKVIAEHNSKVKLPPASLTKMMTLYLAFEAIKKGQLDPNRKINISSKAWKIGGSSMFLEPRMHPEVGQLLHGIASLSGNDASIALAEHMSGTEKAFAERMNDKANDLGMSHSHFVNVTGFPTKGHYSSAIDMAMLGAALWRDFPDQYRLFGEKYYTFDGRQQLNRNRLLWTLPDADGIKIGHTKEAGYCLVGSAERHHTRFVAAVFSTKSDIARAQQTKRLLKFGFNNFITVKPLTRETHRRIEVFKGIKNTVLLVPDRSVWVTVPKGQESSLKFRLSYKSPLSAPIDKGQQIGKIDVFMGEDKKIIRSFPMLASTSIDQSSWISQQWDNLRLRVREITSEFFSLKNTPANKAP